MSNTAPILPLEYRAIVRVVRYELTSDGDQAVENTSYFGPLDSISARQFVRMNTNDKQECYVEYLNGVPTS